MARLKAEEGPAQCACARLRKLTRRASQMYDHALAPSGLTGSQFGILAQLWRSTDASMSSMADRMFMDPTSLTRTLKPLERRKLIRVASAKDDRRRRSITITDAGRDAFRAAVPLWRAVQAQFADALGERAFDALDRSLDLSLQQLEARDVRP
jgi:DNA-binding MarR family transcriptional regulator